MQEQDEDDKRIYNEKQRQQRRAKKKMNKIKHHQVIGAQLVTDDMDENDEQKMNDNESYNSESPEIEPLDKVNRKRKLSYGLDINSKRQKTVLGDDEKLALQLLQYTTKL